MYVGQEKREAGRRRGGRGEGVLFKASRRLRGRCARLRGLRRVEEVGDERRRREGEQDEEGK